MTEDTQATKPKRQRSRKKNMDEQDLLATEEQAEGMEPLALVEDENGTQDTDTSPVIAVAVVKVDGSRVVLEWRSSLAGSLRRAWADAHMSSATENVLEALEPYGDDLEQYMADEAWSRAELVEELHRYGVWNRSELNASVLQRLYQGRAQLALRSALRRLAETQA
jgi:hypothetical protein